MKEWRNNLVCVLAGVLAVLAGLWGVAGDYSRRLVLLGAVVVLLNLPFAIRAWVRLRSTRRELAKLGTPARLELQMPYHKLAARFLTMAAAHEGVFVAPGYLTWASPEHGELRITKEEESDWKALYWVDGHATHGLALYHQGTLAVYPASAQALFEDAFLKSILLPTREAFTAWLSARDSASRK